MVDEPLDVPRTPAEWLKRARGDRKQSEMAALLDVSQPTIQSWESGEKLPRTSKLARVAEVYGVDVRCLVPGAGYEAEEAA